MRDRLLIRHFLWRFLEHDLVSPESDRRSVLSAVGGALVATSLFAAVLVAWPYQLFPTMPPGFASVRALDDRFLFISMSMLVMALAAVGQWDALALDARDTAVLGPLPVPYRVILRSKVAATGLFALAVLAAWNVAPTLMRGATVPAGLRLGWLAMFQLTLAHGVTTSAAGLFGFLSVLGLREAVRALVGSARFETISTLIQAVLILLLTTALLLLPGHASRVGERWAGTDPATAALLPPLWFIGLHETLAGPVIDGVARRPPPLFVAAQEKAATALYRRLRPAFSALGRLALVAWLGVSAITVAAYLWNSRRLPSATPRSRGRPGTVSRTWAWLLTALVVRTPLQQAGFFLATQAATRRATHRIVLAAAAAVALSLIIVADFGPARDTRDGAPISLGLLATQSMVIAAMLTGFRHTTRLPAELRGGLTFHLAWPGVPMPFVRGVKRAGWMTVVLPTLTVMALWHVTALGPWLALRHLGVGVAVAIVTMDALFFHNRRVPFASVYVPSQDAKLTSLLYGATVLSTSVTVAFVERASFAWLPLYVGLLTTLVGISTLLRYCDRVSPTAVIELDRDADASLPTQRLNLSS